MTSSKKQVLRKSLEKKFDTLIRKYMLVME